MSHNIVVVRVVSSTFDADNEVFRRKVIGADGCGYEFVRPVNIDRDNMTMESAVVHDVQRWLRDAGGSESPVIALAPKTRPLDQVKWLPEIKVARPTRHYWLPDRQQVHSRVKSDEDQTYNLFTPLCLLRNLIQAFENQEFQTRAEAYNTMTDCTESERDWTWDDITPQ